MMIDKEFDQKLHIETLKNDVRMSQPQIPQEGVKGMITLSIGTEIVLSLRNLIDSGVCYIF